MGWYILVFFVGAALGGAGVGFVMWNYQAKIREELERARAVLGKNL